VAAQLGNLAPTDVRVECLIGVTDETDEFVVHDRYYLSADGTTEQGETRFKLDLRTSLSGLLHYKLRIYPHHELLSHAFETGYMIWL
jgi:starch phosphorylase